ncbi:MAG: hypothetical protein FWC33_02155 [Candidatus Bathyarchaeota archaeon]|nr:hypothetical protein [Candidatus Termiticorpusculum sp.]
MYYCKHGLPIGAGCKECHPWYEKPKIPKLPGEPDDDGGWVISILDMVSMLNIASKLVTASMLVTASKLESIQRIVDVKAAAELVKEGFLVKQELQSGLLVLEKVINANQIANDALIQERARLQKL